MTDAAGNPRPRSPKEGRAAPASRPGILSGLMRPKLTLTVRYKKLLRKIRRFQNTETAEMQDANLFLPSKTRSGGWLWPHLFTLQTYGPDYVSGLWRRRRNPRCRRRYNPKRVALDVTLIVMAADPSFVRRTFLCNVLL